MRSKLIEILLLLLVPSCAYCLELPNDINDWHCVNEYVMPLVLDVNSSDIGSITYRDYKNGSRTLQVIVTQGSGTGGLYVPKRVRDVKGVMPSGSGYDVLEVSGFKAVLERHEHLPISLSVNVSSDTVITFESSNIINEEDITYLAGSILSTMR